MKERVMVKNSTKQQLNNRIMKILLLRLMKKILMRLMKILMRIILMRLTKILKNMLHYMRKLLTKTIMFKLIFSQQMHNLLMIQLRPSQVSTYALKRLLYNLRHKHKLHQKQQKILRLKLRTVMKLLLLLLLLLKNNMKNLTNKLHKQLKLQRKQMMQYKLPLKMLLPLIIKSIMRNKSTQNQILLQKKSMVNHSMAMTLN